MGAQEVWGGPYRQGELKVAPCRLWKGLHLLLSVLGMEVWVSPMLDKHSAAKLHLPPCFPATLTPERAFSSSSSAPCNFLAI